MVGYVTASVAVSSTISHVGVRYIIHPSESDSHEIKTIRFSELDRLHALLTKQVPWFYARLPPKTLMRRTTADFVESRRAAIEVYLRTAATHKVANASIAWREFFSGCDIPSDASAVPSEDTDQRSLTVIQRRKLAARPPLDFNSLLKSSAARCADNEKNVLDSARAIKDAVAAVEDAHRKLAAIAPARHKDEHYDGSNEKNEDVEVLKSSVEERIAAYGAEYRQRAALKAVVEDLDHVLLKKNEANNAASAALAASRQELRTIKEKKKSTPRMLMLMNAPRKVKPIENTQTAELIFELVD